MGALCQKLAANTGNQQNLPKITVTWLQHCNWPRRWASCQAPVMQSQDWGGGGRTIATLVIGNSGEAHCNFKPSLSSRSLSKDYLYTQQGTSWWVQLHAHSCNIYKEIVVLSESVMSKPQNRVWVIIVPNSSEVQLSRRLISWSRVKLLRLRMQTGITNAGTQSRGWCSWFLQWR